MQASTTFTLSSIVLKYDTTFQHTRRQLMQIPKLPNELLVFIGSAMGYSFKYVADRKMAKQAEAAVNQTEVANLRASMLSFEERLRTRDSEWITLNATIAAERVTLNATIAKITLQNEECERKFIQLQSDYDALEAQYDDMKDELNVLKRTIK